MAAQAEGRSLIGPAAAAPHNNGGRYTAEEFQIEVAQRRAICPAGQENTQCSRLEEHATGKVAYRFNGAPTARRVRCGSAAWGPSNRIGRWSWANTPARCKRGGGNKRRRPLWRR